VKGAPGAIDIEYVSIETKMILDDRWRLGKMGR
jgi:hypothetical protein